MSYMTVPDGVDPLVHRAEMTAKYGYRAFDMMKSTWVCSSCQNEVPPPPAMVLPFSNFRSSSQAHDTIAQGVAGALSDGAGHSPCPSCGGASRLAFADLYVHCSAINEDLVIRHTPNAPAQIFSWSKEKGAAAFSITPQVEQAIARDAILRTAVASKEEGDDANVFILLAEGLAQIPGDSELLKFLPWVNGQGNLELSAKIASIHTEKNPQDPEGYFWQAQAIVEAVGSGQAPQNRIDQAVPLLEKATSLRPDYPDALIALANVSRIRGRDSDAEKALRALIANHPDHPEANYTLGLVLLQKNPEEALGCFERGEKSSPNDADYPRSRARALMALGRIAEAKAALDRARSINPHDPRIDEVESQLAANSPAAKGIQRAIQGVVGIILVGTLLTVVWFVYSAVKPAAANTAAPAKPPAAATTPAKPAAKK